MSDMPAEMEIIAMMAIFLVVVVLVAAAAIMQGLGVSPRGCLIAPAIVLPAIVLPNA